MATTLVFDSEESLRAAMTTGLVPAQVQGAPVRYLRRSDGALAVEPRRAPGKRQLEQLLAAGVQREKRLPVEARSARCWAEIVPAHRVGEQAFASSLVLFVLSRGEDVLPLAGELLRLGCDRQELCFRSGRDDGPPALLRAIDPPYYTVAKAVDRTSGLAAFMPLTAGQEQSWIEVGYAHPFADMLRAADENLLLVCGDGRFSVFTRGEFIDLYRLVDIELPTSTKLVSQGRPQRLRVTLELCPRARQVQANLWVIQKDSLKFVDSLVKTLPEREIAHLLFAVGESDDAGPPQQEPIVVLKARVGRTPPALDVPGRAYASWLGIDNLYLPAEAILDPPLRPETLRQQLAADPDQLTWLQPLDDEAAERGFQLMRIDEAAFLPLGDWVDYVVHHDAVQLRGWSEAVDFELDDFESIGVEWSDRPEPQRRAEKKKERPRSGGRAASEAHETEVLVEEQPPRAAAPAVALALPADRVVEPGAEEKALAELQSAFFELDGPADDPARLAIFQQMAPLYARQGRVRQAALCWTRVIWTREGGLAGSCIESWVRSFEGQAELAQLLEQTAPRVEQVYAVAAALVAAPRREQPLESDLLRQTQVWLDAHQSQLDVRSLWLVRLALSQLVGSDTLGLSRARDEVIGRLTHGLSLARDVPAFVRLQSDDGSPTAELLSAELEALFERYRRAKRNRTPVEAPENLTGGYVRFLFAYGFARLGHGDRARQLSADAVASVGDETDAIHRYLLEAYRARIAQALEGMPREAPLPAEISAQLNGLERFARYKVDRLRQVSDVLEPHERLDPTRGFTEARSDPRGEEFAPMRALVDQRELVRAVADVMKKALTDETSVDERVRLLDGAMDFFPRLPEDVALPHLRMLIGRIADMQPLRRCRLLSEALMLAGLFGRGDLVAELASRIEALAIELGAEHVSEVGEALGEVLRALRRVGQRERATSLLQSASRAIDGDGPEALVARLQLAAGLADLGHFDQARPALERAIQALSRDDLRMVDRLRVTRAMAVALSYMPRDEALAGLATLAAQLPRISDSFNTNSHFCLSVIQFIESLVLGYASEQLSLGATGRAYLDEDESLLRQRIDADLRAAG